MGAAGWHICFDVLERLLAGEPIGRMVGVEAMKFGWQRPNAEYAKQFGMETPKWPPQAAQKDFFEGDKVNRRALKNLVRAAIDYNQIKLDRKAPASTRARVHKSKK